MGPSDANFSICASSPSRSLPQWGDAGAQGSLEEGVRDARPAGGAEKTAALAAELEEIRRLRAARYKASKESVTQGYTTSMSVPNKNLSASQSCRTGSSSCCVKNQEEKPADLSCANKADSSELKQATRITSFCERATTSLEPTARGDSQEGWRSRTQGGRPAPTDLRPIEVIDGNEEESALVDVSSPRRTGAGTTPTSSDSNQESHTDPLPIWNDQFDLLTWNVDGLDNEALRPRTSAVVDVIASLRPAVVFLQEVVHSTLTTLRSKLEKYYYIFTPSVRKNITRSLNAPPIMTCEDDAPGGATSPSVVEDAVGFPYFVVILLCRDQMVPLTPEALCEWFPLSRMGRHMLGVVTAPLSRPDDRFLMLTSHLESMKEYHVERINQFKRCMRVLTDTFAEAYNEECSEPEAKAVNAGEEATAASEQALVESVGSSGDVPRRRENDQGRKRARDLGEWAADTSDDHELRKKSEDKPKMTDSRKRVKPKDKMRELPAFVGIFGGDMNLRDSELRPTAAASSRKGRIRQKNRAHSRSQCSDNNSNCEENALCTTRVAGETSRNKQTMVANSIASLPERASLLLPGVEDVWEFLGCPASAEFTWDMLRNDNKHTGSWKTRLRFDRLYWYGTPAADAAWKQSKTEIRGRGAPATLSDTVLSSNVGKVIAPEGVRAPPRARSTSEKAEAASNHCTGSRCEDSESCALQHGDNLMVTRWTWKPESLRLVGTRRLPTCGRFASDHFGLLARFKRHPVMKDSPVPP